MSRRVNHKIPIENKHAKSYIHGVLTCVALQALLLLICSEGMGVQRDQDVTCIYIYRYTH